MYSSKPIEIIASLWEKMKGTEMEPILMSILHAMLHLGLSLDCKGDGSELAKKVWGIIEKLIKQFDVLGNGILFIHLFAFYNFLE